MPFEERLRFYGQFRFAAPFSERAIIDFHIGIPRKAKCDESVGGPFSNMAVAHNLLIL